LSGGWTPHGVLGEVAVAEQLIPNLQATRSTGVPFPGKVVDAAAAQDLGPELVHLAW